MLHNIIILVFLLSSQELAVEVTGNLFFSSKYLLSDNTSISNLDDAERLISSILSRYNDAGFPFCKITPELLDSNDNEGKLILNIIEGTRVIIEDVYFRTDGNTDVNAAKRFVHWEKGEYFSSKKVTLAKTRLMRTKSFASIREGVLDRDGKYYLLLALEEVSSDFVTVSGSLSSDETEFGASFSSYSLLGTLRQLNFNYEYQRLFSLEFREPVLISPATLDANFSIWTYDTARLIAGQARFKAPIGEHLNVSLLSGIELVNYYRNDTASYESSDNLLGIGLGFDYDKYDWSCSQQIHLDYLFRDADRLRIRFDGDLMMHRVAIGIHYHRVHTDSLEFFDYLRVGGARTLRGYLEDEFLVNRALWLNLEYHRLPIFPLIDIARLDGELLYSYGLGLEARSSYGDASIIVVWPKDGTWRDGKLHLALARGF